MLKSIAQQRLNGLRSPKPLLSLKMAMVLFLCVITIIQLSRVGELRRPRSPANTKLGTTGADTASDCLHPSEAGPGCASPSAASVRAHLDEDLVLPSTTHGGIGLANIAEISRKLSFETAAPTQPQTKTRESNVLPFEYSSKGPFECLLDTDDVWQRRRARVDSLTKQYCTGHGARLAEQVPIVIAVRFKLSDKRALQLLVYASNIAARFNDIVYILSFDAASDWRDPQAKFKTVLRPNVRVVVLDQGTDPVTVAFRSFNETVYNHISINSRDYELYCFQRWFGINKFVELHNLTNIVVLDSDVLLFANATQQRDLCFDECPVAAPSLIGTYTSFWTRTYLGEFTNYIFKWYATKQYKNVNRTQVSDMELMKFFIESRPVQLLPTQCISAGNLGFAVSNANKSDTAHAVLRGVKAYALPEDRFYQDEIGLPLLYFPSNLSAPVYMSTMHFQGNNKRKLQKCFSLI